MNKHETPRAREIAKASTILRTQVGSDLHGVTVSGHDDRDEMGICIEPPECVIGLEQFEQYQYRTQPEGHRSGPGDLDLVIYSLRKWSRLAAQGNPTVIMPLFAPEVEIVECNDWGRSLRANKDLFLSRECGRRFLGYLKAQKEQMLGLRSKHTNRPELIEVYGFDTKFAYHALRLGIQGAEVLATGNINLPMLTPHREYLRQVRIGRYSKDHVLGHIDQLYADLDKLTNTVDLPDKPDYGKINRFLIEAHQSWWDR
ncbi:DNA polymerase beta superfamily protein [Mycobacterium sp. CnD-18-1]|uniref:DNA polymerase beta superfamily protein n=1 Tax=Mycobacterium sp. CnD-18-1 TaxID=2917744 RepID=UPI001EF2A1F9|nr:nucleotidyltransferase domain-containing protein [Mycobacterium sp. CnD-18-1]MCG7607189.1 nucleotidyltransferase domain-containing protein [Mycobacterium sp. CnD-18-1]